MNIYLIQVIKFITLLKLSINYDFHFLKIGEKKNFSLKS